MGFPSDGLFSASPALVQSATASLLQALSHSADPVYSLFILVPLFSFLAFVGIHSPRLSGILLSVLLVPFALGLSSRMLSGIPPSEFTARLIQALSYLSSHAPPTMACSLLLFWLCSLSSQASKLFFSYLVLLYYCGTLSLSSNLPMTLLGAVISLLLVLASCAHRESRLFACSVLYSFSGVWGLAVLYYKNVVRDASPLERLLEGLFTRPVWAYGEETIWFLMALAMGIFFQYVAASLSKPVRSKTGDVKGLK